MKCISMKKLQVTHIRLLNSTDIMAGSLKKKFFFKPIEAKTKFLSSNLNEVCDEIKILLQMKRAGNILTKIMKKLLPQRTNC